jgi:hypothetical protein
VTIWYPDPTGRWRDRGVQLRDGDNRAGCAEYVALAELPSFVGSCYQFHGVPKTSKIQVRVHYDAGLIRDYYFDFGGNEPVRWVGTTREE